jgi:cysteine desulfurase/selenocysteine lyase
LRRSRNAHVSNALGTINPIKEIIREAHAREIPVLIDGAQGVPHMPVDVQDLDCDFYAFSGHKMFGPTGTGILYGREALLDKMPPYQGGGDMILEVSFSGTTYNELPYKFEAGTPNISGMIGLGAAVEYLQSVGMHNVESWEHELLDYMTERLREIEGIHLIGTAAQKAGVQSFLLDDIHPHDLGTILDHQGVAIRTGHHCAMPVMEYFGVPGTARASLALYNNRDDIDQLVAALRKAREIFA